MKYAFITQHQQRFSVIRMCHLLDVSTSAYYEWRKRPESPRRREDQRLAESVKQSHVRSRMTYGARRIQKEIVETGEIISRNRVARLMRQQGLESKVKRKFKATTNSNHDRPVAPNRLDRDFQADRPNQAYVGDITYIATHEGWLYLAVLIDLYSRAVVGWSMAERMTAQLANDALTMAIWKRKPPKGLLVHSDRGSQYASALYQNTLQERGFICSMSRKGNCWDNAPAESFFHTLKTELTHHRHYQTREEAKQEIFEYIEVFYNRQRRHSTIGYQSPARFEQSVQHAA